MKRCIECGFSNQAHHSICEKCGTPLTESPVIGNNDPLKGSNNDYNQAKTIKGRDPNLPYWDDNSAPIPPPIVGNSQDNIQDRPTNKSCPKCNYPLLNNASTCPNCGIDIIAKSNAAHNEPPKEIPVSNIQQVSNVQQVPNKKATVKIGDIFSVTTTPKCELRVEKTGAKLEFEGEIVDLSRSNLDPQNPTISQVSHAQLSFENGQWHLTDQSSNHATFIQVSEKTPLKDGTIILLGNQIYRFKNIE